MHKAWQSLVGKVVSPLRSVDRTGPGLKFNCADGFQRQRHHLLAAWVGDYPEHITIAQVTYGWCPMCEIPNRMPMGQSTSWALDNSSNQDVYSELLDETNIDVLHTLRIHPIHKQFWQWPLYNVCHLSQPNELHQLLVGLVKHFLHWQLKLLNGWNVKDQIDNRLTSVPQYRGLQEFPKQFNATKSSSWQGIGIRGIIRTLPWDCTPNLDYSKNHWNTPAETASDLILMVAVQALRELSLHVYQQSHSD